jgi:glycosyltransferase involved in cell wall biosynthesis
MHVVLADPSLVSFMGHAFEYVRALRDPLHGLGHTTTVLGHVGVSRPVAEKLRAVPCFRHGLDDEFDLPWPVRLLPARVRLRLGQEWTFFRHALSFCAALRTCEAALPLGPDALVVFPTIRHNQIWPIVRWVEGLSAGKRPRVALVLHFTAYPEGRGDSQTARFYQRAFRLLERSPARDQFRLFADSEELVEEYRGHARLPVALVPIPHVAHAVVEASRMAGPLVSVCSPRPRFGAERFPRSQALLGDAGQEAPLLVRPQTRSGASRRAFPSGVWERGEHPGLAETGPTGPVRLTYAGDARLSKGFHLLPFVFDRLKERLKRGEVEAEVQANVRNVHEDAVHVAVRRLRRLGVRLFEEPLRTADYYALLKRASVVLLPYLQHCYHSQTSGIFAEALALGKPVVVPRGTWMARQLRGYGAGLTFVAGDPWSLSGAVVEAVDRVAELSAQARDRAAAWTRRHSAASFWEALLNPK